MKKININILLKFLLLRFVFLLNNHLIIIKSLNSLFNFNSKFFLVINFKLLINFKVKKNVLEKVNIKFKTILDINTNSFNFIFFFNDSLIIIELLNNFLNFDNELFLVISFKLLVNFEVKKSVLKKVNVKLKIILDINISNFDFIFLFVFFNFN